MNDLLYSLVGASPEGDPREEEKTQREDGSWLIDGQYPLIDFLDEFDLEASEEDTCGVKTLGGIVMLKLRSEEHTSELQSLMRNSYAVYGFITKNIPNTTDKFIP